MRLLDASVRGMTRRPGRVVAAWVAIAAGAVLVAPDLTRTIAARPMDLLPRGAESARAVALAQDAWPIARRARWSPSR